MKAKTFIMFIAMVAITMNAISQQKTPMAKKDQREAIQAQKVAFLTQKLNLTPEEAQIFWPVYNQCQKELGALRERPKGTDAQNKGERNQKPNIDEMSDKEVEDMMKNELNKRRKAIDIHESCINKYKKVLPIKKVAKLHDAEKQFRRELLNKMKDRRQNSNTSNTNRMAR